MIKHFILLIAIIMILHRIEFKSETKIIDDPNNIIYFLVHRYDPPPPSKKDPACSININGDLPDPQPLILKPGNNEFLYPLTKDGVIHLEEKETVEVFCSSTKKTVATCQSDGKFLINDIPQSFNTYKCDTAPVSIVNRSNRKCTSDKEILEVGFDLGEYKFIKLYEVCHDPIKESNLWVHHQITPASNGYQKDVQRETFQTPPGFYNGADVNEMYKKEKQLELFTTLLGSPKLAEKLVEEPNLFLSRGHLAAKTDFIFELQQIATFWFTNVAPQWQSFNGGNWEKFENSLRKMAADSSLNLDVYTGTFGIMTTLDIKDIAVELYLHIDDNKTGFIPVPKIFYKVVIDEKSKNGIAIIGVNNPFINEEDIKKSYLLCDDIADKIKWIQWDVHNIQNGYMYACEVGQFTKAIGQLPELTTSGILI